MEKWLMVGDTFTGWTGDEGNTVTIEPNESGYFFAVDRNGKMGKWHVQAIKEFSVRRPADVECADRCPRCGIDLEGLGHPQTHNWDNAFGPCSYTWEPPLEQTISYQGHGGLYEVTPAQLDEAIREYSEMDLYTLKMMLIRNNPQDADVYRRHTSRSGLLIMAAHLLNTY